MPSERTRSNSARSIGVVSLVLTAWLAGCTGSDESRGVSSGVASGSPASPTGPAPTPTATPTIVGSLTIGTSGCALDVDGPVSPGPVGFSAVNETDVMAAFNIAMLDERATFDRFAAHIREEIRLAQAGKPVLGHPWFAVPLFEVLLQPGQSGTLSGTLDPGRYVLTCARVFEEVGELRPLAALGPLRVG